MEVIIAILSTAFVFSGLIIFQRKSFSSKCEDYQNLDRVLSELKDETKSARTNLVEVSEELNQKFALKKSLEEESKSLSLSVERLTKEIATLESKKNWVEIDIKAISKNYAELDEKYTQARESLSRETSNYNNMQNSLDRARTELREIDEKTKSLQSLDGKVGMLVEKEKQLSHSVSQIEAKLVETKSALQSDIHKLEIDQKGKQDELFKILSRIDLYSRVDEFTSVGHYEEPRYLYETSLRYADEIKIVRESQREMIKQKRAVTYPDDLILCSDKSHNKKILDGQANLLLLAFNVECDFLIEKVSPSNLSRTLEQIENKAEQLEKNCATLKCGFSIDYVDLKFKECGLEYEYKLKKQSEQEEQRLIREQMKEEARLQKQYEEAMKDAEREELLFRRLLEKAKEELDKASGNEYSLTLAKISELEARLKEAEEKGQRAKSMAEQTRRGFVYVVSNIGAFGEGVHKIGLTRRLDPQERVDELGGASVPFRFDVHAMCYSEDAPALENSLHKYFHNRRINAVNYRKEFFRVSLDEIEAAIKSLVGKDVDFIKSVKASDYYETRRLLSS
jgi:myosin heavy subunit